MFTLSADDNANTERVLRARSACGVTGKFYARIVARYSGARHTARKFHHTMFKLAKIKGQTGFTLTELLVAVSVMSTLTVVGVPAMQSTIRNNEIATQSANFYSFLRFARSEAVKRRTQVVICKSSDGSSCTTKGDWSQGWVVFEDLNGDASVDTTEAVLRSNADMATKDVSAKASTSIADYVGFAPTGFARKSDGSSQSGLIVICDAGGFSENAKALRVAQSGQVRLAKAIDAGANSCTL